jgi:hypothetical protein
LLRKAGIRRKAVEILTEPRERNHSDASLQLCLAKYETHHGNEEIHLCNPQQSVSGARLHGEERSKDQFRIILTSVLVKRAGGQRYGKPGAGSEPEFILHGRFHRSDILTMYLAQ